MEVTAATPPTTTTGPIDVGRVKKDFPVLERTVHGKRLVYLDSASSSQKPFSVIQAMDRYYATSHANVHRGVYQIAQEATELYEGARAKVAGFIGAGGPEEVVFAKNVTEAINLVAYTWARRNLGPGDVVVTSEIEHHANFVPWLQLREERGVELRFLRLGADGMLVLDDLDELLEGAKLLAITAASNVLGTLVPVAQLAAAAHAAGARVLVDAAQYVPHLPTDVVQMGADWVGFTGHKMLGPTGIGVLWARRALLEAMPPFLTGGEMIRDVRLDGFTTNDVPWKFEAGTPPIAEAVGLAAAVDYLRALGMGAVREHERLLTEYAMSALKERYGDDIVIHGPSPSVPRAGIVSFCYKDVHAHDMSQVLDQAGVCVRAGHHCAKPLMRCLGVSATARASFSVYNDEADVDALVDAIGQADALFG
ncbi:MAG TPA: SufS family cysteine desulfurase [Acidimicrobiales bacterium]|nr:SufS family cysteine desulfurase [Acidimicrobiales bacterium]